MALSAGSVSVDSEGVVSGSGMARALLEAFIAKWPDVSSAPSWRQGLAGLAEAIAEAVVTEIATNAEVRITTSDDGLQRDPVSGTPTLAPTSLKTLSVT